ncbi:hypothetical protein HHL11_22645 [Ramlibacter sp. G-1-2-2]|uniref:Uncharacterized protein n=1 Tax=Ramlibacter agri TaxID=2728837 RepID=A0A848H9B8_9BURK|nr:hypothetical protein [Ramlibacter agri]NML46562.1 hypothetical protein [Ramlibacter agri]
MTTKSMGFEATSQFNEGRHSEPCRQATFHLLFGQQGKPQLWLLVLLALWGVVMAVSIGTP